MNNLDIQELRQYIADTKDDINIARYLGNHDIAGNLQKSLDKAETDLSAAINTPILANNRP